MNAVREWAQSVIIAALIAAIVSAVAPPGNLEKPMKIVTALFMLLAFISPLVKIQANLPEITDGFDEVIEQRNLEKQVEEEVVSKLENEIRSSMSAYLSSLGCTESKIEIDMDIDGNKNISINSIKIFLPQVVQCTAEIEKFAVSEFGIMPEIIFGSGEEK